MPSSEEFAPVVPCQLRFSTHFEEDRDGRVQLIARGTQGKLCSRPIIAAGKHHQLCHKIFFSAFCHLLM
jgi:hypothetical protein